MNVLVLNAGSSSLKVSLIEFPKEHLLLKAHVDGIGGQTKISFAGATIQKKIATHDAAVDFILQHLPKDISVDVVAHRVVHGGEVYTTPVKITATVIKKLESMVSIAPLHLPANIAGIKAAKKSFGRISHVAIFDTAFHATIPEVAYRYGVEEKWYKKYGVRRYGFHGNSHEFMMLSARKLLKKPRVNIVSCHLGNGSSICAIKNNKSIETSMGFSPLSGVLMGTRSGDVDPEVVFFMKQQGLKYTEVEKHLEKNSGFKGLMGTNDMRTIYQKSKQGNKKAQFVIDLFSYEVARFVGMYATLMPQLDGIVFTGGIGEYAHYVRKKVCEYLPLLDIKLDAAKNRQNKEKIHARGSKVPVFVIPTNEELILARHAKSLI